VGESKEGGLRKDAKPAPQRATQTTRAIRLRYHRNALLPGHFGWRCVMRRIGFNDCPYCGNSEVYRSHPKTWAGRACVLFLLEFVRCHRCMRHHYRPLFFPAPEYVTPSAKRPVQTRTDDEKRERSA
jgi:hypothetical protein